MLARGIAFLGWGSGRVLVGHGPFRCDSKPPEVGVAFYRNGFDLGSKTPWWIPDRWELMDADDAASSVGAKDEIEVEWEPLEASAFAEVFQEINVLILKGVFEKTVPVVTESGRLRAGGGRELMTVVLGGGGSPVVYGMGDGEAGFAGCSPECLITLSGRRLKTMALAGTARAEEREVLAVDEKEIREHEFVAQALMSKLGDLGRLTRGSREIMDLGSIVHFHTPIEVELDQEAGVDELVRRLHPTPALGPLPRTSENLMSLIDWRERLGVPEEFGSPFGAVMDGEFRGIVAIRGIWWEGRELKLPAGCGVIEASRLVNEWRELRLKREAVKMRFGLGIA